MLFLLTAVYVPPKFETAVCSFSNKRAACLVSVSGLFLLYCDTI